MDFRDYAGIARRRWPSILLVTILVVAVAALVTYRTTKEYASTARVFVSTTTSDPNSALQGGQFSEQRVMSYAEVVGGLELSQRVIDTLKLKGLSAAQLSSKINASVVPNTVVLKITVTDPSPKLAQEINNGVVTQLQTYVTELETPPGKRLPLLKATVVDAPRLPTTPVSPKPTLNLGVGLLLGLLLGLGLAVLRDVLDQSVKELDDVPALEGTSLMASLAYDSDVKEHPLISTLESHAPRVEAFRVLRTNLSFIKVDRPSKAIVVTSSIPGEGKSFMAVNASIAMASAGTRVLLIDGDLRRPQVAEALRLERSVGLTTVLLGTTTLDDALQTHAPSGLHVLTSGTLPPNPAELLQSEAMARLLDEARSRYDVVVIDAPPLLPVTDAAVMASETDGAVLVVRYGKTTKQQLRDAVERLASVGSDPLGVVLNMVPQARTGDYGYGYSQGASDRARA